LDGRRIGNIFGELDTILLRLLDVPNQDPVSFVLRLHDATMEECAAAYVPGWSRPESPVSDADRTMTSP
jgi:hypothetical protein